MKFHLKDSSSQFFQTLEANTRADLKLTIAPLKNQTLQPHFEKIHHVISQKMKENHKTKSPEEFLVELQNLAKKAYPTPVDQPVTPVDGTVVRDRDRFDGKTRDNGFRRTNGTRERHII